MKKILVLIVAFLSLSACSKSDLSKAEVLKDIKEYKWNCAHGAEQRELELKDQYLFEKTGESHYLTAVYKVDHIEDNLFKLSSLSTLEVTKLKKQLSDETNTQHSDLLLTIDTKTKDLFINAFPSETGLDAFKNIEVGHGCELMENIQ